MLKIFNSQTRQKEVFKPQHDNIVNMYVCGMTVYDYCHIGHARVMVAFDVVVRYLRERGYKVNYVRNITDIDDKIIHRANENQEPFFDLVNRFIKAMDEDSDALGVMKPDQEPRATEYIKSIVDMVETLIEKGHAYAVSNGDVYYRVNSFPTYGKLGNKNLDDLQSGARVEVGEIKENPLDFVLWKSAKPNEPKWASPWGEGRPGWHIECSAMSTCCLGKTLDIHGGGGDLIFPHHENEVAQTEGATGEKFVNTWMHVGFVQVNEEKMSKSLGNFFLIRDVLKEFDPETVRYFIVSSHYRSPLNYSEENLANAKSALTRFYTALKGSVASGAKTNTRFEADFHEAMEDDFNSPKAVAVLFDLASEINRNDADEQEAAELRALLVKLGRTLGILQGDAQLFLQGGGADAAFAEKINGLIKARNDARTAKDWKAADRIRDELKELSVILEDSNGETTWRRA